MIELCDACARRGLPKPPPAVWDAPMPHGSWAFLCAACFYRLPATLKRMATRLTKEMSK